MLGQLTYGKGGGRRTEWEDLYGLRVLRCAADPEGWLGERRLRKAGTALRKGGALRTLTPSGFSRWDLMDACGLSPVDPGPFLRAQSLPLTLETLERQGLAPDRAAVALRGLRADREMVRAAAALCPKVRHLIISAPRGGEELARWLRWEFGIPILPQGEEAQVALCFQPVESVTGTRLELYGSAPDLGGLTLTAPSLGEGDRQDLFLMTALWEGGRLAPDGVKIT